MSANDPDEAAKRQQAHNELAQGGSQVNEERRRQLLQQMGRDYLEREAQSRHEQARDRYLRGGR